MPHNIVFSDQANELAAIAREIADKYVRPSAAKYDKAQEYNAEAAKAVAEAGLFKTFVPVEYGGHGAGVLPSRASPRSSPARTLASAWPSP